MAILSSGGWKSKNCLINQKFQEHFPFVSLDGIVNEFSHSRSGVETFERAVHHVFVRCAPFWGPKKNLNLLACCPCQLNNSSSLQAKLNLINKVRRLAVHTTRMCSSVNFIQMPFHSTSSKDHLFDVLSCKVRTYRGISRKIIDIF